MRLIAFDPFVSRRAIPRRSASRRPPSPDEVYAAADFITLHLPKTAETEGWLDARALAKCQRRRAVLNVARGTLIVDDDLEAALDQRQSGRRCDRRVPLGADHLPSAVRLSEGDRDAAPRRLHGRGDRPRRLPGSRAGDRGAEGRGGHERGQRSGDRARGHAGARSVRAALHRAREDRGARSRRGRRSIGSRPNFSVGSPTAIPGCCRSRCWSALSAGHTEEEVNEVNAPTLAEERGIRFAEIKDKDARDYTDLVRVRVTSGRAERARRRDADRPPRSPASGGGVGPAVRCRSSRST